MLQKSIDQAATHGGIFTNLTTAGVKSFVIATPSNLPEQTAIAKILSDVDALIEALCAMLAKKRDIKQAIMQQLLTGKTRLPGFAGEWQLRSLASITDFSKDRFDDGDWIESKDLAPSGVRLIQTGNIGIGRFRESTTKKYVSEETFIKLRCKALQFGDLLICRLAEPAGRACIFPKLESSKTITSVDASIVRPLPTVAAKNFLVFALSTKAWFDTVNDLCGGSTRTRIARGALGKIGINFPPLPEQLAIAQTLADLDTELTALEARIDKTRLLKLGMMQELLTGKTRLL